MTERHLYDEVQVKSRQFIPNLRIYKSLTNFKPQSRTHNNIYLSGINKFDPCFNALFSPRLENFTDEVCKQLN